ncbi:(4Fe-4S)-binding protein [Streptodolium elevatio]
MTESKAKIYEAEDVTVTFDAHRCLHSGECVRGLPAVFDTGRKPWVDASAASPEEIGEVISRCPSGALHYTPKGNAPETPVHPTTVTAVPGGPFVLLGHLVLRTADGKHTHETRAALCRCGHTGNQPYCDGSNDCLLQGKTWT